MQFLKELYEDERRWIQRICIMDMLHLLRKQKDPKWRMQDTADFLGLSKALVSENLFLVTNIELVEHCESREKALIFLRSLKVDERDRKKRQV